MISLTLYLEDIILLKSLEENRASKPSRTTLEITNPALDLGPWIQKIYYMMGNHYNIVNRLKHIQLSLILVAHS